ncbi:pilin [Patescibacteria group bacterium]|nr:pilin [Patescibacteria group bacterium]
MVVDFISQVGWKSGTYTVEVRKPGTHGDLVTSCGFYYTAPGPSPLPPTGCDDPDAIPTAIGCINVKSPEGFVGSILTLAIGIGGGIAMLLIIFGGIQILTSAGNPEKIQAGKELITSAIAGLILIVFSVFILRIIGVEVLEIFK